MERLEVLNPVAEKFVAQKIRTAPRIADLNGKVVGLYWNMKPGGDVALRRTAENLAKRFQGLKFRNYTGSMGGRGVMTADDAARIAQECDLTIGSTAD